MKGAMRNILLCLILSAFMFSLGFLFGQRWSSSSLKSHSGPPPIRMMVNPEPEEKTDSSLTFYKTLEGELTRSITEKMDNVKEFKQRPKVAESSAKIIYSVQIGSYRKKEEAILTSQALKRDGFGDVYVTVADIKGKMYRVRLGHFLRREDAQRMVERIREKTNRNAIVVRYEKGEKE
jgi:cell division protein FtsN